MHPRFMVLLFSAAAEIIFSYRMDALLPVSPKSYNNIVTQMSQKTEREECCVDT